MSVSTNICWLPVLYTMAHVWLVSTFTGRKYTGPPSV